MEQGKDRMRRKGKSKLPDIRSANLERDLMVDISDTIAVVLAGGKGTRLCAVCSDRPKVLAEVRGRPLVTYLLDQLAGAGLRKPSYARAISPPKWKRHWEIGTGMCI